MQTGARGWTRGALLALLAGLCLAAGITFALDPFEHYRESAILPLYDQESYNNPGIARNYDYDAVVLGTSMVEMSHPSVVDEAFGVHSVKLPMRGSYAAQMGWQLGHVLEKRELKLAVLAVDAYALLGDPDDTEELVDYLWNDNPLDDVNYLLNRDVLLVRIPKLLANAGKPLEGKRDAMYQWTDVTFSEEEALGAVTFAKQKEMQDADYRIERANENIERHLRAHIEEHPETRFLIYSPPYSIGYWYVTTREGQAERQYRARERLCELLLDLPNVEIYDFSARAEWVEELNNYFDYSHHSGEISDALMRAMAEGEGRIRSTEEMRAGNAYLREATQRFAEKYEPAGLN